MDTPLPSACLVTMYSNKYHSVKMSDSAWEGKTEPGHFLEEGKWPGSVEIILRGKGGEPSKGGFCV